LNADLIPLAIMLGVAIIWAVRAFLKYAVHGSKLAAARGDKSLLKILSSPKQYLPLAKYFQQQQGFDQKYVNAAAAGSCMRLSALEEWCKKMPRCGDAWLCKGEAYVTWAWQARGGGLGDNVSEEDWATFYRRLEQAWTFLRHAAKLNTDDPTPWCFMLTICTVHPKLNSYRQACFNKAIERDPESWPAHANMVSALAQKWYGEHEEMLDFAYDAAINARDGSDIPMVLVEAFLKYHFYLVVFDKDEAGAQRFLDRADVREAAENAYRRSLGHPRYQKRKTSDSAMHTATCWYWLIRDRHKLKRCFEQLDHELFDAHWTGLCALGDVSDAREFAGID
jgi:hypothetical protein